MTSDFISATYYLNWLFRYKTQENANVVMTVTELFVNFLLCSISWKHCILVKYIVYIWQVSLQFNCSDTCQYERDLTAPTNTFAKAEMSLIEKNWRTALYPPRYPPQVKSYHKLPSSIHICGRIGQGSHGIYRHGNRNCMYSNAYRTEAQPKYRSRKCPCIFVNNQFVPTDRRVPSPRPLGSTQYQPRDPCMDHPNVNFSGYTHTQEHLNVVFCGSLMGDDLSLPMLSLVSLWGVIDSCSPSSPVNHQARCHVTTDSAYTWYFARTCNKDRVVNCIPM